MTHALLVEFTALERFHRALEFPFIQGHWRTRDVDTHWLRFAYPPDWRALTDQAGMALPDTDQARLLREVRERSITHVLFNVAPSAELVRALAAQPEPPTLGVTAPPGQAQTAAAGLQPVVPIGAELDRFLGLDGAAGAAAADGNLFEWATPDFDWSPANPAAGEAPSLPFLICGEECTYRRRLARSPHYADVDLDGCVRDHGCAFCIRTDSRDSWRADASELIARQLRALAATHPPWSDRLAVRAVGAPLLMGVETLVETALALDLPPVDFLLDARADTLLAARPKLQRALTALGPTSHRLQLALIGVESFVDRELERLNKGTTWRDNLGAARALFELEHDYPAHFGFRDHGGLSLLLYSPWTRSEDLALNLAVIRFAQLLPFCGKAFTSRMRLYDSLPITRLAERDGLLVEAYDDPELDTARRNFYPDERPWRFAQPALEAVSRLLVRMTGSASPNADPLRRAIAALRESLAPARDPLDLALAVVDAAVAKPDGVDPLALLATAGRLLRGEPSTPAPRAPDDPPGVPVEDRLSPLLIAVQAGLKPVARIEGADHAPPSLDEQSLSRVAKVVRRWHPPNRTGYDLFVGHDPRAVTDAMDQTAVLLQGPDEARWQDAAMRVGSLLGYPECCSRAFAERRAEVRQKYAWLRLLLRLQQPGEISPLLCPGVELVEWVPCSLHCERTLEHARAVLDAMRERSRPQAIERRLAQAEQPWLILVDHEGQAIELQTESDPSRSFDYRAGSVRGASPLLGRIAEGDRLEFDDQQLCVLRGGRLHAALGARAYLWWHGAAVQRDFWQALTDVRWSDRRLPPLPARTATAPRGASPSLAEQLARQLTQLLCGAQPATEFAGFRVVSVDARHSERACITLAAADTRLRLLVAPRARTERAYATAGALALMHPADEFLETPAKQEAVRLLANELAARYREPPPGSPP